MKWRCGCAVMVVRVVGSGRDENVLLVVRVVGSVGCECVRQVKVVRSGCDGVLFVIVKTLVGLV